MPIRILFVIVLYNKHAEESTTIQSLLSSILSNVTVLIHNNGPQEIELPDDLIAKFKSKNIEIDFVNCVLNKPLSMVYNEAIKKYVDFDRFIIFDDDSEITLSFVESIYSDGYDLQLPLIISRLDHKIYYPMVNGVTVTSGGVLAARNTHSIGSGLIITKTLVDKFKTNTLALFDENYALYGVDVSLFRRIWALSDKGVDFTFLSSSKLIHSLSRTEEVESDFRRTERLIDFAITVRRYPSTRSLLSFCKKIIYNIMRLKFSDIRIMMDSFIFGSHPRCRK